ncbi:MAG TPA: hypothetical protein VM782_10490 [Stellaceae bacterium]|nr:hypothetical protein [Stellaceae bacterium]
MKRITLEQQARVIESWKRRNGVVGNDYVPVNQGRGRTASKRRLLQVIAEDAMQGGRSKTFSAKF